MAEALPASVQAWMIKVGMAQAPEDGSELTTDDYERLDVMQMAVVVSLIQAARSEEALQAQKAALAVTIDEVDANNLAIENWTMRRKIIESGWPTDADLQEQLRQLLEEDTRNPPPPLSSGPPETVPVTERDSAASKERAAAILQILTDAKAAVDNDPGGTPLTAWPLDENLQGALTGWLAAQGIPARDRQHDEVRVTGGYWVDPPSLQSTWPARENGQMMVYFSGYTGVPGTGRPEYFRFNDDLSDLDQVERFRGSGRPDETFGEGDTAFTVTSADGRLREKNRAELEAVGINGQLWPSSNDKNNGDLWYTDEEERTGEFFATDDGYFSRIPHVIPDSFGHSMGPTNPRKLFSVDGVVYGFNDGEIFHDAEFLESHTKEIWQAMRDGKPWEAFIGNGITELEQEAVRIKEPTAEQRRAWTGTLAEHLGQLNSSNNKWGMHAQSQQLQIQESMSDFSEFCKLASNVIEKSERTRSNMLPGR